MVEQNFFPSFVTVVGSGIQDARSGMDKKSGSGISWIRNTAYKKHHSLWAT